MKTPELLLAVVLPELSSAAVVEEVSPVLVDAGADVTPGPVEKALAAAGERQGENGQREPGHGAHFGAFLRREPETASRGAAAGVDHGLQLPPPLPSKPPLPLSAWVAGSSMQARNFGSACAPDCSIACQRPT